MLYFLFCVRLAGTGNYIVKKHVCVFEGWGLPINATSWQVFKPWRTISYRLAPRAARNTFISALTRLHTILRLFRFFFFSVFHVLVHSRAIFFCIINPRPTAMRNDPQPCSHGQLNPFVSAISCEYSQNQINSRPSEINFALRKFK